MNRLGTLHAGRTAECRMMKQGQAGGVCWSAVCRLGPRRFEAALLFWFFLIVGAVFCVCRLMIYYL